MHKQLICLNVTELTRTRIHLQDPWSITFNIPHQQWQNFSLVRCHYITSQQSHAWKEQSRSGKAAPYIIKQDGLDPVQAEKVHNHCIDEFYKKTMRKIETHQSQLLHNLLQVQ